MKNRIEISIKIGCGLILAFSNWVARADEVATSATGPADPAMQVSKSGFGLQGSLLWGLGTYKSSSGTIPGRTIDSLAIEALPGYRFGEWLAGPLAELRFVGQTTEPATVNSTNVKGRGLLLGVGGGYSIGKIKLLAGVEFLGSYVQAKVDPSGNEIKNQKPFGWLIQSGYEVFPSLSADFRLASVVYSQDEVAGKANNVSTDKRRQTDYSVGLSYHL